jgi:hypothetical protein
MKSKWMITSNNFGNGTVYAVYRLLDEAEGDHSGNRELHSSGYTPNKQGAETTRDILNITEE